MSLRFNDINPRVSFFNIIYSIKSKFWPKSQVAGSACDILEPRMLPFVAAVETHRQSL
jgi:hypothetical protein